MRKIFLLVMILYCPVFISAQGSVGNIKDSTVSVRDYTHLTFKTTRIVLGQSIENVNKGSLLFTVAHHFGRINQGGKEFFGLTTSTIRLGMDYGITDRLSAGFGISTYQKNLDGSVKFRILRQYTGEKNMPISVSYFGQAIITTAKWQYPTNSSYFSSRISYTNQILIARKFNKSLSLQLTPSFIHYNFVELKTDQNNVFDIGAGGRYKITKHTSVNIEYHYLLPGETANNFINSLSIGVDIETGGHVFQLFITNSQPLIDRGFIAETKGQWNKGGIYFGFNINRIFSIFE
jgi:opacity protein-like surface antigen